MALQRNPYSRSEINTSSPGALMPSKNALFHGDPTQRSESAQIKPYYNSMDQPNNTMDQLRKAPQQPPVSRSDVGARVKTFDETNPAHWGQPGTYERRTGEPNYMRDQGEAGRGDADAYANYHTAERQLRSPYGSYGSPGASYGRTYGATGLGTGVAPVNVHAENARNADFSSYMQSREGTGKAFADQQRAKAAQFWGDAALGKHGPEAERIAPNMIFNDSNDHNYMRNQMDAYRNQQAAAQRAEFRQANPERAMRGDMNRAAEADRIAKSKEIRAFNARYQMGMPASPHEAMAFAMMNGASQNPYAAMESYGRGMQHLGYNDMMRDSSANRATAEMHHANMNAMAHMHGSDTNARANMYQSDTQRYLGEQENKIKALHAAGVMDTNMANHLLALNADKRAAELQSTQLDGMKLDNQMKRSMLGNAEAYANNAYRSHLMKNPGDEAGARAAYNMAHAQASAYNGGPSKPPGTPVDAPIPTNPITSDEVLNTYNSYRQSGKPVADFGNYLKDKGYTVTPNTLNDLRKRGTSPEWNQSTWDNITQPSTLFGPLTGMLPPFHNYFPGGSYEDSRMMSEPDALTAHDLSREAYKHLTGQDIEPRSRTWLEKLFGPSSR